MEKLFTSLGLLLKYSLTLVAVFGMSLLLIPMIGMLIGIIFR